MLKRALLLIGFMGFVGLPAAVAQISYCATHPEKVACTFSSLYTVNFNGQLGVPQPDPFSSIAASVGSQLAQLPLASPASGIIYNLDPNLGIQTASKETFGPVFAERGETIGAQKLFVAFTYQNFAFSSIDGVDLKKLPTQFNICFQGQCSGLASTNRIDLKVRQYALFATYGATSRLDLSVAVPILDVRLGTSVVGCTPQTAGQTYCQTPPLSGQIFRFTPGTFISQGATGIGDIVVRGKVQVMKGEHYRLAVGLDARLPTGDELNLLGTGAIGIKPFVAFSRRGRLSPHANLGYQWNGDSNLGGSEVGSSGKIPNDFSYNGGFDFRATKRVTVAADFLGDWIDNAKRFREVEAQINNAGTLESVPSVALVNGSFSSAKGSLGVKYNPFGNLLLTANVLQRFDHNGLRNKTVPLFGASYTF